MSKILQECVEMLRSAVDHHLFTPEKIRCMELIGRLNMVVKDEVEDEAYWQRKVAEGHRALLGEYDDQAAKLEGWALFLCDDGCLRIQRLDCPKDANEILPHEPIFESDVKALYYVANKAVHGSSMHAAALVRHGYPESGESATYDEV